MHVRGIQAMRFVIMVYFHVYSTPLFKLNKCLEFFALQLRYIAICFVNNYRVRYYMFIMESQYLIVINPCFNGIYK